MNRPPLRWPWTAGALALLASTSSAAAPSRDISPFAATLIHALTLGERLPYVIAFAGPDNAPKDLMAWWNDGASWTAGGASRRFGPFRTYVEADPSANMLALVPFTVAKTIAPGAIPASSFSERLKQYGGSLLRSEAHNRFVIDLFRTLEMRLASRFVDERGRPVFHLSERDLFHAHAFYSDDADAFGLLFHMKEYCGNARTRIDGHPIAADACTDIAPNASTCRMDDRNGAIEFRDFRNVIWLAKTNRFTVLNAARRIGGAPNPIHRVACDNDTCTANDGLVGYSPDGWPSDIGPLVDYCRSIQNVFGRELFTVNYLGGDLPADHLGPNGSRHQKRLFFQQM